MFKGKHFPGSISPQGSAAHWLLTDESLNNQSWADCLPDESSFNGSMGGGSFSSNSILTRSLVHSSLSLAGCQSFVLIFLFPCDASSSLAAGVWWPHSFIHSFIHSCIQSAVQPVLLLLVLFGCWQIFGVSSSILSILSGAGCVCCSPVCLVPVCCGGNWFCNVSALLLREPPLPPLLCCFLLSFIIFTSLISSPIPPGVPKDSIFYWFFCWSIYQVLISRRFNVHLVHTDAGY